MSAFMPNLKDQKPKQKGPACGHSNCSQNFIDTGNTECVNHCDECGAEFAQLGPGAPSAADPTVCTYCYERQRRR